MRLAALALLLVTGCATAQYEYVSVPMECSRDSIDCKILEFNCRNAGKTWTGAECK